MSNKQTHLLEGDVTITSSLEPTVYGPGNLNISGNLSVTGTISSGTFAGSTLAVQYGGTGDTTLTANSVLLGNGTNPIQSPASITYASSTLTLPKLISNDTTASTSASIGSVLFSGGLSISNTTDATSSTNGGTITTAGGLSVAKSVYIGSNINVTGNEIISGILMSSNTTASTSSVLGAVLLSGGLSISNTTDAVSVSNGGSITTSGGLAVAKSVYIGSALNITGNEIISGILMSSNTTASTSSVLGAVLLSGGLSISNTTDAVSVSNGGSITTAGGLSVAKSVFIGGNEIITGILTSINTTASTSSVAASVLLSGGLSISNTTDASSVTNGGSATLAGGLSVAKSVFIGTTLSVGSQANMNSNKIINVTDPVNLQDAATKNYVDNSIYLRNSKQFVKSASTTALTLSSQVQNLSVIDGVTLATGDRVLIKDQTNAIENGIYVVQASGSPVRAIDLATGSSASMIYVFVQQGTLNADTGWVCTSITGSDIVGTNNLTFIVFTVQSVAGIGLSKVVNTLNVNPSQTQVTALGTITIGTWNASTITVPFGGTGQTTLNSNSVLLGNGTGAVLSPSTLTYASNTLTLPKLISNDTTSSTSASVGAVLLSGGLSISNTTDAVSATNGGSATLAGGLAIAKSAFIGTALSVGTNLSVTGNIISGTWNGSTITVPYGGTGQTTLTSNAVLLGNGVGAVQSPGTITYSSSTLTLPKLTSLDVTASTSNSLGSVLLSGGLSISNTTDAVSSTNGGTFTTAGGLAVAKSAFIGTALSVGTNLSVIGNITSGTWTASTITVPYGGTGQTTLTANAVLLGNGTGAVQSPSTITYASNTLTLPKLTSNDTTASTSSILGAVLLSGGLSISNTTDAVSATNGGTFTTAGGLSVAKSVFIGTNLSVTGNIVSGTWNASTITVPYGGTGQTTLNSNAVLLGNGTGAVQSPGTITYASSTLTLPKLVSNDTTASTSSILGAVLLSGGLSISNTTDAVSATNGGTFTTAGGLSVAKSAYIGTSLSVGTNLSVTGVVTSGTWNASTVSVAYGGTGQTTLTSNAVLLGNGTGTVQSPSTLTYASSTLTLPKLVSNDTTSSTSASVGAVLLSGGLSISNTTDAVGVTNGGTFTTAGGLSVAKSAYIGTNLSVTGNIVSGTWNASTITVPYGGTGQTTLNLNAVLLGNGTSAVQSPASLTYASSTLTLPKLVSNDITSSSSATVGAVLLSGGLSISNATDASNSTNGGSATLAGGLAVAKSVYIGTSLSVGGQVNVNSNKIVNLLDPTANQDAATKYYVDTVAQGLNVKKSVVAATTQAQTLATDFASGSVIDGTTLATGNRVLIKDQANAIENGIYVVNASGAPTRASDFAAGTSQSGSFAFVETGTVNDNMGFVLITNPPNDVVGTNSINFTQFSGAGQVIAGIGLSKNGNTLSVNASQTQVTALGTITTGTWNASTITVPYGGTGQTTLTSNAVLLGNGVSGIQSPSTITYASSILTLPGLTSTTTTASTSSSVGAVLLSGGLSISNTTDATSATNGGTITTAGGLSVGKSAYIGTSLSVGTNLAVTGNITSGTWNASTITVPYGGTGQTTLTANAVLLGNGTGAIQSPSTITYSGSILTLPGLTSTTTTASSSSSVGAVLLSGGLSISNTTDAVSATNGGTITTSGGIAVAKSAFIGTALSVGTTLNVSGIITSTNATASASNVLGAVLLSGGLSISNTTDAVSATNGGTITTAGGLAVAKSAFIGTALSVGTNLAVTGNITSGTWNGSTITVPYGGTGVASLTANAVLLGNGSSAIQSPSTITYASSILTLPGLTSTTTTASTSSVLGAVLLAGGLSISNTTDASNSSNGGTITTAGGLAVAKSAFIGTALNIGGIFTSTNSTASTSNILGAVLLSGGISISNTTDAVSATNGGTITTAGGLAVAKSAFIGTALSVGTNLSVTGIITSGTWNASTITVPYGGTGQTTLTSNAVLLGNGTSAVQSPSTITYVSSTLTLPKLTSNDTTASTSSSVGAVLLSGGLSIALATDASNASNGGTLTSAGGFAFAKSGYIGTSLSVGTSLIVGTTTTLANYIDNTAITAPGNPATGNTRFYVDTADALFKSKSNSGVVTVYQPTNTKGDITTHNGTNQVRLPVGTNNYVLTADSTQTNGIAWKIAGGTQFYYFADQKTVGTNGGASSTGSWMTRTLNTTVAYPAGSTRVTLSANILTFTAGTYFVTTSVPGYGSNSHTSRLFNTGNSTVLATGTTESSIVTTGLLVLVYSSQSETTIQTVLTFASTTTVALQHQVARADANGLGLAAGFQTETYSYVNVAVIV